AGQMLTSIVLLDSLDEIDRNTANNSSSLSIVPVLDSTPPTSRVAALPAFSPGMFTVSWSGADDPGGTGLASFDVYVSDDNGAFTRWQTHTTQTSATYAGQDGHTYGF